MPTYEYRCPSGHITEKFAKISESTSQVSCAVCGAVAERQISGGAGLVFKGSGFYLTDYGKSGAKAEKAKRESGGEGKSESKSDTKSDTKSDDKSEGKADGKSDGDSKGAAAGAKPDTAAASTKKDSATAPAAKPSPKTE